MKGKELFVRELRRFTQIRVEFTKTHKPSKGQI